MPLLVTLNENWNASIVCLLSLLLHHYSARCLLKLAADFIGELRVLAAIGVVRNVSVLAGAVLVVFVSVGATKIVLLTINLLHVALSHQMPTLLDILIFDLGQISVQ